MNQSLNEHLKKLNPTGIEWEDMTEEQKEALRKQWDAVVSIPKNLTCTCPRTGCRNNHNCAFCCLTHRDYGSLPDCLRIVDDKLSEGVPPEKRHNIHTHMNPNQKFATNRNEYADAVAASSASGQLTPEQARKNVEEWHKLVRDPKKTPCSCPHTDCWYHGNCVKCIALHRAYDGFPYCCRPIHDKIDAAVQAYRAEQAAQAE